MPHPRCKGSATKKDSLHTRACILSVSVPSHAEEGAYVCNQGGTLIRTVPCGMAILGTQRRQMVSNGKRVMMLRMSNG